MPPLGLLETLPRLEGLGSIGSEETRWVESCSAEKRLQKNIVQHGSPSTRFRPKVCARDWGGKDCCMFLMYIYNILKDNSDVDAHKQTIQDLLCLCSTCGN